MSDYESVFADASRLPIDDRLRLIDELAASVPDDRPTQLSREWLREIAKRSDEIDSGSVTLDDWTRVRGELFTKHGLMVDDHASLDDVTGRLDLHRKIGFAEKQADRGEVIEHDVFMEQLEDEDDNRDHLRNAPASPISEMLAEADDDIAAGRVVDWDVERAKQRARARLARKWEGENDGK